MTKLADLWGRCDCHNGLLPTKEGAGLSASIRWRAHKRCAGSGFVPVTADDLRSVLADPEVQEALGAKPIQARRMSFAYDKPDWWLDEVRVDAEGVYLVVPLSRLEDTE